MYQACLFFSILILFSAFNSILSHNPIHSVFWLVLLFIQSAILSIMLAYEYLGFVIVIIYIGAIAILFLFVIMMLDIFQLKVVTQFNNMIPIIILVCWEFCFGVKMQFYVEIYRQTQDWRLDYDSHALLLGKTIYNDLGFLLVITSFLLLVSMIGAIIITLEINELTKKQNLSSQHYRNNSWI
uniref:NADH-ubiquinone oxidoreductase chain 6 n=1 Tax=Millepora sp. EK-2011 TaxID=1104536 RepID=G9ISP7_9CNID|nr:NADH dehydrogenase subunit 6 [Millepora sp. EK-2011]